METGRFRSIKRARVWTLAGAVGIALTGSILLAGPATSQRTVAGRSISSRENTWVNYTLAHLTTAEKVGQLFEVNGYGKSVNDPDPAMVKLNQQYYGVNTIAQLIRKYHVGGIIYFDWTNNLQNPSQTVNLSNGIQRVAMHSNPAVPMVISTDQEQGEVLRIGPPATVFPGNMALGATRSVSSARRAARITGLELRAMGINVDNAPVLDVNVQPLNQADGIRAYGDRVGLVSKFGVAQVNGYQTQQDTTGVGATAKHWPGFGDSKINSDTGIARSPQTLAQVKRTNVPSFRAAMRAGIDRIMVTHILFPKITGSKIPTSLSPFWVDGFLRRQLHWNGPVVTDALDAAALNNFSPAQVALMALRAGDDELLEIAQTGVDTGPADLVSAYQAVMHAVRTGAVSMHRLDQSVRRILSLKWKLGLVSHPFTNPSRVKKVVGTVEHLATANTITRRSITLVKNSAHVLPLAAGSGQKVLVTGFGQTTTATLGQDIASHGLTPTVMDTGSDPTPAQIASAVASAQQNDLVVVSTFNAWSASGQINLVNALVQTGKPVIVAAVGTPYDIAYFPSVSTFLTSYDFQPVSLGPLVDVMFGVRQPTGRLPVTIRKPAPSKKVLYPFGFGLSLP
ncbi:MAG TPA: glycoside hydrolase family 3 N-terminal domain-containing protein [Solirubrobacteraceae bacterium]|nr:glycoside hydrolase family 3 N-terminal domain-containing protein [Solirubrobacteraceae bacterium]